MEFDSIKKIVEAETKAEDMKQKAKQEAKAILEKAENSKESMELYFKKQLELKKKNLEKEKSEETTMEIKKLREQTDVNLKKLRKSSEENIPKAVDTIFQKIIRI